MRFVRVDQLISEGQRSKYKSACLFTQHCLYIMVHIHIKTLHFIKTMLYTFIGSYSVMLISIMYPFAEVSGVC